MSLHMYRSLQIEILKQEKFSNKIDSFFIEHKSEHDLYSYSILRSQSRAKITELYMRLVEEEDTFSSLAEEFSEGPESHSSGYISPRPLHTIDSEIAERLKVSRPGQLWQPFQNDQCWMLLRLEKFIPCELDSNTSSLILDTLFNNWMNEELQKALSEIKSSSSEFTVKNIIDFRSSVDNTYLS